MNNQFPSKITPRHRACMGCGIIRLNLQFKKEGCINCKSLPLKNCPVNINEATSNDFKGFIGMVNPKKSWVAKWQRINDKKPGLYAMLVDGELPEDMIGKLEDAGEVYFPRDKSFSLQ